jgi:hypothetical protein
MPKVAARVDREGDGVGVGWRGIVDVAVKSSAFRRLVLWLSDVSSIRG